MQKLAKKILTISLMALLLTACFSIIAKVSNSSKPSIEPDTSLIKDVDNSFYGEADEFF